jgi:predicted enzyme related to lactoylglutathione lyase
MLNRKEFAMAMKLSYAIKFVADMDRAIEFYKGKLGLQLKFQSPDWTEFDTGGTILALHMASKESPAGTVRLGFNTDDIDRVHSSLLAQGVKFARAPEPLHGVKIAAFLDSENSECSLSG